MPDQFIDPEPKRFRFGNPYGLVWTFLSLALLFAAVLIAGFALPNPIGLFIAHMRDRRALFSSMSIFGTIIVISLTLMWKDSPPVAFSVKLLRILSVVVFFVEVLFVGVLAVLGNPHILNR